MHARSTNSETRIAAGVDSTLFQGPGYAYADAVGVALLAVTGTGQLFGFNERLVKTFEVPTWVLRAGHLEAIVEWLQTRSDEAAVAVARLLSSATDSTSGHLQLQDDRTIAWRKIDVPGRRGYLWAFEDISPVRQTASALVDAANWLEILELHTDGVLLELDEHARILGIWGPSEAYFEEPDGALQGKSLIDAVPAPASTELDARVRQVLSGGTPEKYEYTLELHGTRRVFTANALLMPNSDGRAKRATLMIRDVSERAQMQARLIQADRLASIGLLAAGVAHEINNPLGYLLLNLERVQRDLERLRSNRPVDLTELGQAIDIGLEGARRVRSIVQDLTHFSRSDDPSSCMPVDVRRPLEFAATMAEPETNHRGRVVRDYGETPLVRASEARLSQLFLNLIVNAAHAIPEGQRLDHEIRLVTRTDAQGNAIVEVHDTGIGIAPEDISRIFEPFYTTKPSGMGTGLGLTICQGIAAGLNGRIDVETKPERGTVFRVVLPPHSK